MEWLLEIALVGLLAVTLFHAVRLERALGVLKRDRAALEDLVTGFNASTRAAEQGIERLRQAADGGGRQLARQTAAAQQLKDDLLLLAQRGDQVADRLEIAVRSGRKLEPERGESPLAEPRAMVPPLALLPPLAVSRADDAPARDPDPSGKPSRSQAERELLKALRMAH